MFKLDLSNDYSWPVKVDVAGDKGLVKSFSFTARFRRFAQDELDQVMRDVEAKTLGDEDLANRVLVGWEDVSDADGTVLEVSPANKAALLNTYPVRPAVIGAFFESLQGGKRKN
jgi:hypothetical protein